MFADAQRRSDPAGVSAAMRALGRGAWREPGIMDMLLPECVLFYSLRVLIFATRQQQLMEKKKFEF
jgi:hypothetical protein